MRKIIMAGLVVILAFCMVGCNGNIEDQVNDLAEQKMDEMRTDGSDDNGSAALLDEENLSSVDTWPSGLDGIPEFVYGDISKVQSQSEEYEGIEFHAYNIDFVGIQKDAGDKYAADLSDAGFRESDEPYSYESSITGKTVTEYGYDKYSFETEDTIHSIQVDFWTDDANNGSVYISVPLEPESGVVMNNEDDEVVESGSDGNTDSGSEYNWDTLSEAAVPDDYPHNSVPIVEFGSAVILGTSRQEMGGMGVSYVIIFGIDEDMGDVCDKISSELEQYITGAGGTFRSINAQMFMGEIDDCQYTIAVGDGTADGYKTVVDYTVIKQ